MLFSIQKYFPNLFISIVLEGGYCRLLGQVYKNKKITKSFENVFDNPKEDTIDEKVITYIQERSKHYNGVYLAFYLNSSAQGALPGTRASDFKRYNVDVKNVNIIKVSRKWSFYASILDVKWAKNLFMPLCEVDLLYSPFALMHACIQEENSQEQKPILYVYNHETSFAVGIFEGFNLLFGTYFIIAKPDNDLEDMVNESKWTHIDEEDIDKLVELEDIRLYDESKEEYGSLEDIENLDEDEDIYTKLQENINNANSSLIVKDQEKSLKLFGRNMFMYNYLIRAINEFYGGIYYKKVFLDSMVIYDNQAIEKTVVNMIESELMMNVRVKKVDTLELISEMAIKDIFS